MAGEQKTPDAKWTPNAPPGYEPPDEPLGLARESRALAEGVWAKLAAATASRCNSFAARGEVELRTTTAFLHITADNYAYFQRAMEARGYKVQISSTQNSWSPYVDPLNDCCWLCCCANRECQYCPCGGCFVAITCGSADDECCKWRNLANTREVVISW